MYLSHYTYNITVSENVKNEWLEPNATILKLFEIVFISCVIISAEKKDGPLSPCSTSSYPETLPVVRVVLKYRLILKTTHGEAYCS